MPRGPRGQLRRLDRAIQTLEDEVDLFTVHSNTSTRPEEVEAIRTIWKMRDRFVCRHGLQEIFIPSESMMEDWEPSST